MVGRILRTPAGRRGVVPSVDRSTRPQGATDATGSTDSVGATGLTGVTGYVICGQ